MIWLHCNAATEPRDYVKVSCLLGEIEWVEARSATGMLLQYFVQLNGIESSASRYDRVSLQKQLTTMECGARSSSDVRSEAG
jgi:hypothetical protein